jgi:hypothetical protein
MAGLATDDPRAAAWERRLRPPVLTAAVAVLPLLALHLTHPHGALAVLETAGHWAVWLVFVVEAVVMLRVVRDRRAWIDGHRFELLVVVVSSPLVPLALVLALALAVVTVAYMLTGESALAGAERTVALVVAGMLATFGVNHLRRRVAAAR